MTFIDALKNLRHMNNVNTEKERRQQLCEELRALYCAKVQNVAQFTEHAEQMYYPQFRERLLRIAAEERAHVSWLRQQLQALDGKVPQPTVTPRLGHNSWECLLLDLESEKRSYVQLRRQTTTMLSVTPALGEGLQRLRADEQRHHQELQDMWMKSDPYTPPTPRTPHPELARQKEAWIDQQKGKWFARERADWEAAGRPVVWAEWEGELEKRWTVNEMPTLDLIWKNKVAEEELAHRKASSEDVALL